MSDIVLVHGGWHGGWCWRDVARELLKAGHHIHAPTMTGLGERSHLIEAVEGPDTHVTDIVNVIRWNELKDVVLVGHSYGGMIITGVASQIPQEISSLIYLDAFVPTRSGQAANTMSTPERTAQIEASIRPDGTIAPNGFERWSSDPKSIGWLRDLCTPHPANCFGKGVTLTGAQNSAARRMYIWCEKHDPSPFRQFHETYRDDPNWRSETLPCLHDAMIDMPVELAQLIHSMTETT